jgi:outer membrane cobalamin receptor
VGSVLGSDSLGGVINVITRRGPPVPGTEVGASVETRFSTADRAHTAHAEVYGQGQRHRFLVGGTYRGQR